VDFRCSGDDQQRGASAPPSPRAKDGHEDWMDGWVSAYRAYDMVIHGWELNGGSVHHPPDRCAKQGVQRPQIVTEAQKNSVSFLTPTTGRAPRTAALALPGLDRNNRCDRRASIRDVIAFPKTQRAQCLYQPGR
jgi:aspartyl-tRNA synthetase